MNWKRSLTAMLIIITVMQLSACIHSVEDNGNASPKGSITASTDGVTEEAKQEPYTIKILAPGAAEVQDCADVSALASEITLDKFNTTLEIFRSDFSEYTQQMNLILASGEKLDLMYEYCANVTSAISSGQILAIDDYLHEYGKDLLEQISEDDWACVSYNGKIYGVPANKEKVTGWGFIVVKEMADTTGIDYENIKTEKELEPLLQKIKELYPDVYPVVPMMKGAVESISNHDILGGSKGDIGCLIDSTSENTTVVNYYASDKFREEVEIRYDWAQKGLIMPDASTSSELGVRLIAAGKGFGMFSNTKPGIEAETGKDVGKEMYAIELTEPYAMTSRVDTVWYVPHSSEHPERAIEILNEAYTNPELSNILINGIEGVHYQIVDATKGIITYPDGVDTTSTGYTSYPWAWPNEMISYIWEGYPEDIWEETIKFNEEAAVSPAMGFTWDNSPVQNEVIACENIRTRYEDALLAGSLNPDIAIPKMLEELDAAGVDKIIAEKQRQLDEWLANN